MDIGTWLRNQGLEQYASAFRDNGVDMRVLPKLTAEDLKNLGVTMVGHRRVLLEAIAGLHEPAAPSIKAERPSTTPDREQPAATDAERRQVSVMFCWHCQLSVVSPIGRRKLLDCEVGAWRPLANLHKVFRCLRLAWTISAPWQHAVHAARAHDAR